MNKGKSLTHHPNFRMPKRPSGVPVNKLTGPEIEVLVDHVLEAAARHVSPPKMKGEDEEFSCGDVAAGIRSLAEEIKHRILGKRPVTVNGGRLSQAKYTCGKIVVRPSGKVDGLVRTAVWGIVLSTESLADDLEMWECELVVLPAKRFSCRRKGEVVNIEGCRPDQMLAGWDFGDPEEWGDEVAPGKLKELSLPWQEALMKNDSFQLPGTSRSPRIEKLITKRNELLDASGKRTEEEETELIGIERQIEATPSAESRSDQRDMDLIHEAAEILRSKKSKVHDEVEALFSENLITEHICKLSKLVVMNGGIGWRKNGMIPDPDGRGITLRKDHSDSVHIRLIDGDDQQGD